MPTIDVNKKDLEKLLGRDFPEAMFERWLLVAKGEPKGFTRETGEMRVELKDTNRPDLWCAEGIARQLRCYLSLEQPRKYFSSTEQPAGQIIVNKNLRDIRPFVGGFIAQGVRLDDEAIKQFIQTQEKIADNYGRFRKYIAIGIYNAKDIAFPIKYSAEDADKTSFHPLESDRPMTLREILNEHPTGKTFGKLLEGHNAYPILRDNNGAVLSMPPIINSHDLGRVKVGDDNLFVEVTGLNLAQVTLIVNILAANLVDRGATIKPVETVYPQKTVYGKNVIFPYDFSKPMNVERKYFEATVGMPVAMEDAASCLSRMGNHIDKIAKNKISCRMPAYRADDLHAIDFIEDYCIAYGFENFKTEMPDSFTIGRMGKLEELADRVRYLMVGLGGTEVTGYILSAKNDLTARMNMPDEPVVEIANFISESFSILRNSLIPALLQKETVSAKSPYPHRLFEVGEAQEFAPQENLGSKTVRKLACLLAHQRATFSELYSLLNSLMFYLNTEYRIEAEERGCFIPGRSAAIIAKDKKIGYLGEIHPQVLENWNITMPVCAFELRLNSLLAPEDDVKILV